MSSRSGDLMQLQRLQLNTNMFQTHLKVCRREEVLVGGAKTEQTGIYHKLTQKKSMKVTVNTNTPVCDWLLANTNIP